MYRIFSLLILIFPLSAIAGERTGSFTTSIQQAPPYANAISMLRRATHGLVYREAVAKARNEHTDLQLFTVNPAEETWSVFVPSAVPDGGRYGALVWISSDDDTGIPAFVQQAAEASGWTVISAHDAGENQPLLERRLALALIGTHWLNEHYPIDKQRIVIGGSGEGAAVALQLGTGYADIYSGVMAINGGMPIGSEALAVPVRPLPDIIRQRSDVIFIASGEVSDGVREAIGSFESFCVPGTRLVHETGDEPTVEAVAGALDVITASGRFPPEESCIANLDAQRRLALLELKEVFENNRWREARDTLIETHFKYGGLVEEHVFQYADAYERELDDLYATAAEFIRTSPRSIPTFVPPANLNTDWARRMRENR